MNLLIATGPLNGSRFNYPYARMRRDAIAPQISLAKIGDFVYNIIVVMRDDFIVVQRLLVVAKTA